jgi:amidase
VYGPIARHVADAALFMDAAVASAPALSFLQTIAVPPQPLRIAISMAPPKGSLARIGDEQRAAVDVIAGSLRQLGHTVIAQEIDYPFAAFTNVLIRYLRAIHDDAVAVARPQNLEPRTKSMSRLGGLVPKALLEKARAQEPQISAQICGIFDDFDVVLTPGPAGPPFRIGQLHGHGALRTLNTVAARIPLYPTFNAIGVPAASIPAGFDTRGLPLSVQLVAPHGGDGLLLALAEQLEGLLRWGEKRPQLRDY